MRHTIATALVLVQLGLAWADPPTPGEIVKATKPSIALIEKPFGDKKVNASAFAVAPGGYFVTTLHSLPLQSAGEKVTLILHPGDAGQKEVAAIVVRTDLDLDLALLKVGKDDALPALAFAAADPAEKDELILFAFPNARGVGQADYPPVSVATAITGLPKGDSGRVRVNTKAVTAGIAGAPAMDAAGKVAGVMAYREFVDPAPILIPVGRLRRFVERPEITFTAPAVEPKERYDLKGYSVKLAFDPPMTEKVAVELVVRTSGGERRYPMKATDAGFEGSAAAFVKDATETATVQVEVKYADGTVRVPLADRVVTTKAGERRLSEIGRITFGKGALAELADGTRAEGEVTGLDGLIASVGGQKLAVKTAEARELIVTPPPGSADGYLLAVVATVGGREVGRQEVVKYLTGTDAPPLAALKKGNFAKPREALTRRSYVTLLPTAGEPIGIAKRRDYGAETFRMELVTHGQDMVRIVLAHSEGPFAGRFMTGQEAAVQLFSPPRQRMVPGDYPRAVQTHVLGDEVAGMNVWTEGLKGTTDNPLGHFVVHECEVRAGKVTAFAADFRWQPDGTAKRVLVGVVRFNSKFE